MAGREADLTGRHPPPALRPRLGTGAVARPRRRPERGGGAVLAQAGGGGGDAGDGGRTGGGTDTGAVEEVLVKRAIDYIWYINIKKVIYS